jgi:hypothetical protein
MESIIFRCTNSNEIKRQARFSEYIQIAAGIYAIALFYTIVTFRRSKRLDQIGTLNGIMSDLRDLECELTKIPSYSVLYQIITFEF